MNQISYHPRPIIHDITKQVGFVTKFEQGQNRQKSVEERLQDVVMISRDQQELHAEFSDKISGLNIGELLIAYPSQTRQRLAHFLTVLAGYGKVRQQQSHFFLPEECKLVDVFGQIWNCRFNRGEPIKTTKTFKRIW
jgi:hypothetical protein